MKITVVTDENGHLVGTIQGQGLARKGNTISLKNGEAEAGVFLSPGHSAHELDVEDTLSKITDPIQLHEKLTPHLPKAKY
jgi:hypothetical protein